MNRTVLFFIALGLNQLLLPGCAGKKQQVDELATHIQEQSNVDSFAMVQDFNEEVTKNIAAYFQTKASEGRFSGVVLLQQNRERYLAPFGMRNYQSGDSIMINDQFQLASLTKPIVAYGLLALVQNHKIDLDEYVTKYLFDFPYPEITVRSLLSHTSGMGNYIYSTDNLWATPDSFMTNADFYEFIRCEQVPTYYPAHKRFDYCNTNYAMVPVLIEAVSNMTFIEYMEKHVFEPLGMRNTEFLHPWSKDAEAYAVQGHYPDGSTKSVFYLNGVIGDKGLYSTVEDLWRFYREVKQPTLISKKLRNEALCPQAQVSSNRFYGLGWRIEPLGDDTIIYHNGWWRGFRSYFWMSSKENKVAIILTNNIRGGYLDREEVWQMF